MKQSRRIPSVWSPIALCLTLAVAAQASVLQKGTVWTLENQALTANLDTRSGLLTVRDKRTGTTWEQEDPATRATAEEKVRVRQRSQPVTIDGSDKDWLRQDTVWLPWTGPDGERNCSGGARLMWDDKRLYLYVRVRDDNVAFGGESPVQWWEADSVEFWVDSVQVGLHLAPTAHEVAATPGGEPIPGYEIAVRRITNDKLPGYAVELAVPIANFPILRGPRAGVRFRFAIGLNDADPKPGETPKRVAQGYFPRTWVHSVPQSFAVAVLTDDRGQAPPPTEETDRAGGTLGGRISDVKAGPAPDTLTYDLELTRGQLAPLQLAVRFALLATPPALEFHLTAVKGEQTQIRAFSYPLPLYPDAAPDTYFLAVADYCDGRYVPVTDESYRRKRLSLLDLPFVTVTDGKQGLMLLALTPFDAAAEMKVRYGDKAQSGFPALTWLPSKGAFGPERSGRLVFYDQGGYVSACKIYRNAAKADGHVRTLREKAKTNPNVLKLLGAVDWWGAPGLSFVKEARAAGMRHGLLNGRPSPEDMAKIVARGWLVGEYDNYVDINDSPTIARAKAPVKEQAVVKANGELMTAWITRDKDMKPIHTYMKHCTAKQLECARVIIPKILAKYPYNARFLDVTTAEGLKECYSPVHPTTRTSDMQNRRALASYLADELELVTGGEHGRFWDVDIYDYHEGMMGGGMYSWPAGYLRDVTSRDQLSKRYLTYSIDAAHRVPLFELVFHDCVVNYWYWGACSDYLNDVAPEITDRKTAMNVLYGTPPMMWADAHGLHWSRPDEREKMLTIYRNVCKLHEIVGTQEMLAHEFLTDDREVQRTRFAGGTVCTANFGRKPYSFTPQAKTAAITLRENDFYVSGPAIEEWRITKEDPGGKSHVDTFIRTADFLYVASPGRFEQSGLVCTGKASLAADSPESARLTVYSGTTLMLDVGQWRPAWASRPLALLTLDEQGRPVGRGPAVTAGRLQIAAQQRTSCLLLAGARADRPDLAVTSVRLTTGGKPIDAAAALSPKAIIRVNASVANLGLAPARNFDISIRLDSAAGPELGRAHLDALAPGKAAPVSHQFPANRADGKRRIVVQIMHADTLCQTGQGSAEVAFTGPLDPQQFPLQWPLSLRLPPGDCGGMPVETDFSIVAAGGVKADPVSLRVLLPNGLATPAQFEPSKPGALDGKLVFRIMKGFSHSETIQTTVLGLPVGAAGPYPHTTPFDIHPDGLSLRFGTYACSIVGATLHDISVIGEGGKDLPIISQVIESSKETGWSSERGDVRELVCEHSGPVRAVFRMRRKLEPGFALERRWLFYGDRFEVQSRCTPPRSLLTRTFFTQDGTASNQTGAHAVMDGKGDGEDFGFTGNPQWYAVVSPLYRCACIALSPASGFTYWDSGSRGQIGLGHSGKGWERRVYILGGGADNDAFAKAAAQAYKAGIVVSGR